MVAHYLPLKPSARGTEQGHPTVWQKINRITYETHSEDAKTLGLQEEKNVRKKSAYIYIYIGYRNLSLVRIHVYVILKDYMVVIRDSLFNILEILNSVERKNKILIRATS